MGGNTSMCAFAYPRGSTPELREASSTTFSPNGSDGNIARLTQSQYRPVDAGLAIGPAVSVVIPVQERGPEPADRLRHAAGLDQRGGPGRRAVGGRHRSGGQGVLSGNQDRAPGRRGQRRCAAGWLCRLHRRHHRDDRRRRLDRRPEIVRFVAALRGRGRLRQGLALRQQWRQRRHHLAPAAGQPRAVRHGEHSPGHPVHRSVLRLQRILGPASSPPCTWIASGSR